jgi:hypothetical protein
MVICCESAVEPYSLTTNIVGTATDRGNGYPLDSATVLLMRRTKRVDGQYSYHTVKFSMTNENGYYEISTSMDKGVDYYLQALRSGYHPIYAFSRDISVRYKEYQRIDIRLKKKP